MTDPDIPEADRAPDAPHPRHTAALIGQEQAEAAFLAADASGRRHHAWLITGPRGIGKATLAWRIARFLLSTGRGGLLAGPPDSLSVPEGNATAQIAALSHPGLFLLRRAWDADRKRLRAMIDVDGARALKRFLQRSAADGGHRVVIVDAADELNPSAANAILKVLEEPPAATTFLLVAHAPARLLPTIRSRCRVLRCQPLPPDDLARALQQAGAEVGQNGALLAALADGSVGEALRLLNLDGPAIYATLLSLLGPAPDVDRPAATAFADKMGARGNDEQLDMAIRLAGTFMARLARAGVSPDRPPEAATGEAGVIARLSPDPAAARRWAAMHHELGARLAHGRAVNLDPSSLILDMVLRMNEAAGNVAAR